MCRARSSSGLWRRADPLSYLLLAEHQFGHVWIAGDDLRGGENIGETGRHHTWSLETLIAAFQN